MPLTNTIVCSAENASQPRGMATSRCCFGCTHSVSLPGLASECTGAYGAGLLRYLQQAHLTLLEVATTDNSDRRKRVKDDMLDACNAAHAAFAGEILIDWSSG